MDSENRIGEFLRARREQVRPDDVGLPDLGGRRVPGLRREELARLAGVSPDYYVRLEQGRDQHPSAQVIESLSRALRLGDEATAHLHDLARPAPRRRRSRARAERARPGLLRLMEAWPRTPAFIVGRWADVLAANPLATALNQACAPGHNMLRWLFLCEESARELHPDFETVATESAAWLRVSVGGDLDDPRFTDLVGELSLKSELFRKLWARHDVRDKSAGVKHFNHPLVGPLELGYENLTVNASGGQMLTVYHAEPGSASERALTLLSSMPAPRAQDTSRTG